MPGPSLLPQFHVVGFTGHRQLARADEAARWIDAALADLAGLAPGEWLALSSAAAGSDQLFARTALARGLAWQAVLPMAPAEFREDFAPDAWPAVESLIAAAEAVDVLPPSTSRDEAYLDCGIETVNGADVLIALWDGEPARGRGGTADVVAYARELRKPLIVIDPATGERRDEHLDGLRRADAELEFLNALPGEAPAEPADARARVEALHRRADAAANRSAPQYRALTAATVLLHVAATTLATAGLAFDWHPLLLPWAKLLLVLGALAAALAIRHYGAQRNWVRCRLAAEISRAALATWGMPRRAALFEDLELPNARQLLRSLHLLHRRGAPERRANLDTFRQRYRESRLEDQLRYYGRQLGRAVPLLARLRLGFAVSTLLAIGFTAAYALHHTLHLAALAPWLKSLAFYFLPVVLPAVAAAFVALVSINDLHRRVARYREMQRLLELAVRQISVSHTWRSVEHVVRHTERALLQEVLEWHTLTSHAEAH